MKYSFPFPCALLAAAIFLGSAALLPAQTASRIISHAVDAHEKGNPDLAISLYGSALNMGLNPQAEAMVFKNRALAWLDKGQWQKALEDCDEALKREPSLGAAFGARAEAWKGRRDLEKAVIDYGEAIRLEPAEPVYHNNRGSLYEARREWDLAIQDFSEAIKLDPKLVVAWNSRGRAHTAKGSWQEAIADFTETIRLEPGNVDARNNRAVAYERSGQTDRALADLNDAIRLAPQDAGSYRNRGTFHVNRRDWKQALADFRETVRLMPNDPMALNWLARLLSSAPDASLRDGPKAVAAATKACELVDWRDPEYLDTLGAAHAESGQFPLAIQYATQAMGAPNLPEQVKQRIQMRLQLYLEKKPFHIPGGS